MIPHDYITEWRSQVSWVGDAQVEQDLVLSRAIIELFSQTSLASSLAFREATALYKLHLRPAPRYSEDIELLPPHRTPAMPIRTIILRKDRVCEGPVDGGACG